MIDSVVVPLDGSRFAEAALPTARWLARSARGNLHLVHVNSAGDTVAGVKAYLGEAADAIARQAGPPTDFAVLEGSVAADLPVAMAQHPGSIVVMATRGHGELGPIGRDSVAECLAFRASRPVLLVKPGPQSELPCRPAEFRRVLAAVDVDRDPVSLMRALIDFACLSQAHVTLLAVVALDALDATQMAARCQATQRTLDRLAASLRDSGVRAAARVVAGAPPGKVILAEVARSGADVVVVQPRPGAISRDVGLRTTDTVIRGASKPVLVVPST